MLYNTHSPFHEAMETIGELVILNLLFILTSIPVVTIGPSLNALFYALLKRKEGTGLSVSNLYFEGFKDQFLRNLLVGLCFLLFIYIVLIDLIYVQNTNDIVSFIGIVIGVMYFIYLFPVIATFKDSTLTLIKNAFLFMITSFPINILLTVIVGTAITLAYSDFQLGPLVAFCYFFFGFSLLAYIIVHFLHPIFSPYLNNEGNEE